MTPLEHSLERTVTMSARRETVFAYLTDSVRFAGSCPTTYSWRTE